MKRKRILILFITLVLCILVLSVMLVPSRQSSVVSAASDKPKGKITKVFRKDKEYKKSDVLPDWVDKSFKKSKEHLDTGGKGWGRGVLEPEKELDVLSTEEYDTGETLVRMDQWFNDVPVFGGQINMRLGANSEFLEYGGRAFGEARHVDTKPKLSAPAAIKVARADLGYAGTFANEPDATLMILPNYMIEPHRSPGATLVYQVDLMILDGTDATADHLYFIDANNGVVVWHYNNLQSDGIGRSQYSGDVSIRTIPEGGTNRLQDYTRGATAPDNHGNYTVDYQHYELNPVEKRPPQPISYYIVTDPDNTWGDGFIFNPNGSSENRQTAAVDAHYGMMKTLDYYSEHGHRF